MLAGLTRATRSVLKEQAKGIYYTVPLQFRYGAQFRDTHRFLMESQWWTRKALEAYQMEQLAKVLSHACRHVPYYQRIFSERGLKAEDIQNFEDLRKLPFLTKDD